MTEIELLQTEIANLKKSNSELLATIEEHKKAFTESETARIALETASKTHKEEMDKLNNRLHIYESILPRATVQAGNVDTTENDSLGDKLEDLLAPETKGDDN